MVQRRRREKIPTYRRLLWSKEASPRVPELVPRGQDWLAVPTPGVPDLGQVTGDFALGGLSVQTAGCGQLSRRRVEPGPARAASPRGRIVSSGSRAPTAGPRRCRRYRRRRRSERVGRSPSARSHGNLGPSGEAGGDAELHSPGFEPTLTVASTAGRPQEKEQTRRLEPKTRDAGCKGARFPISLATTAPRAAPAAERAPVPGHPFGAPGSD